MINPFCRTVDVTNIFCTSCYVGYALYQGNCIDNSKLVLIGGANSYCASYDTNGQCTQCSSRYYLSSGVCNKVSDQCNTYDPNYGYCTSCYLGYQINPYGDCTINGSYWFCFLSFIQFIFIIVLTISLLSSLSCYYSILS
jgi:hypothetical protein